MIKTVRKALAWIFAICLVIGVGAVFSACAKVGGDRIGEERAIELAFNHFGFEAGECTVRKIELDEGKYEIEFVREDKEYEVEIDARSGKVRERDVEYNDDFVDTTPRDTTHVSDTAAEMITADRAKELAIAHFSLNASECNFVRAELDGRSYEIEFICNGREYDAEIDAYSGKVIEADVDKAFD